MQIIQIKKKRLKEKPHSLKFKRCLPLNTNQSTINKTPPLHTQYPSLYINPSLIYLPPQYS